MPVPKRKTSRSRRDMRRSHHHIKMPTVSSCPQCHEPVLPHRVCMKCGTYKGKTVIKKEEG
ncbi:MAG: 50S ribosomal protein L32 [Desulfatiglandales bacterium]